jgi:hypothetical protein
MASAVARAASWWRSILGPDIEPDLSITSASAVASSQALGQVHAHRQQRLSRLPVAARAELSAPPARQAAAVAHEPSSVRICRR